VKIPKLPKGVVAEAVKGLVEGIGSLFGVGSRRKPCERRFRSRR